MFTFLNKCDIIFHIYLEVHNAFALFVLKKE
mgnify:CR=1 FL=1